jgi:serine/threonine protein kinase/tetratricopeptide (TPR) repeat protein
MSAPSRSLKELFLAALEMAPEHRDHWLESECVADASLRRQLDLMLAAHDAPQSLLDQPDAAARFAPTIAERPIAEGPGTAIGPYKLLEQIGEGGFGVVFMAEQQQPVRRKVALKVLKPGMDTRQVVARFEAERQALALMDHPHIARVFDGGTTETGRPYFVMELVRGVPITEFCDQNCLAIRQRLELFIDVCQAVQHAHQKGIIHRDIKPSNVLVTLHDGQPVVKVIDFGIVKAIGQQLTEKTLFTNFSQLIGTPLYMSPEQAEMSGLDVDTRSDVYSLGVLLYELLTGTTPFENERLRNAGYDEMRRIIREEEPPLPSTRISTIGNQATTALANRRSDAKQLSGLLRGELDWIVMKALEKDRNRRYETASALAADVQHNLRDEPVLAAPPTARYRLRKLLWRQRGLVAAIGAVLAVLLAGIATTSLGFLSARAAQRRADENFEIASNAVDDYLNKVTEDSELKRSDLDALRKKLLESAVPFYARLVERKPGDAAQEAARGRAYDRLGALHRQMGETAEALADYEQMYAIFARLSADFPTVSQYRENLADSRNSLGLLLAHLRKRDEAEAAHRAALAIREKLAAEFPTVPKYRDDLARTRNNLGVLLSDWGEHAEAETECRSALAIREKLAADFPAVPEYRDILAGTRTNLGMLLSYRGEHAEAEAAYRSALAIHEQLVADFPTVPEYRKNLAVTHRRLGLLLAHLGRLDEAEAAYRAVVTSYEKLAADVPTVREFQEMLAWTACQLAFFLADRGDLSGYQECCHTLLSSKETDPARACAFVRASLLLAGGVRDPGDLAPLVWTARSLDQKNVGYQWVLFAQGLHDYRCGRFAEARTECVNSRERATFPAVAVMAQTVEAMSLYRLEKTDEAWQALPAGRLPGETAPKLGGYDLYDWLCCRILLREAKELLESSPPASPTQRRGSEVDSAANSPE